MIDQSIREMKEHLASDGFVTVKEACIFLGVGRSTLYNLMSNGKIPFTKIGAASRIPRRALVDFAASHMILNVPKA